MNFINLLMQRILSVLENEPQRIGLSQFKPVVKDVVPDGPSLRRKDVKLSDLMRRAG